MGHDEDRVVAVANVPPLLRRGLCDVLRDAGHVAVAPDDPVAWLRRRPGAVAVVGVAVRADLLLLRRLSRSAPTTVTVTLLERGRSPAWHARCLELGAHASLSMDADPAEIVLALRAALLDHAVLPYAVALHLVRAAPAPEDDDLAETHVGWLRCLAAGTTVEQLADEQGYSRRAMYRHLRRLYQEMGVTGRTEALVAAARRGLV